MLSSKTILACIGVVLFDCNAFVIPRVLSNLSKATRKQYSSLTLKESTIISKRDDATSTLLSKPQLLPAKQPLKNFTNPNSFSILTWNILLPNSEDNWWCHKMYSSSVPDYARTWKHRQSLIRQRLLSSSADIICVQEADGNTFEKDFAFMEQAGYSNILHKKYRFRCATFYKDDKFEIVNMAHKDRTLITTLRMRSQLGTNNVKSQNKNEEQPQQTNDDKLIHVINCHLSGGAAPERRLRQIDEALDQLRKWKNAAYNALAKQLKRKIPLPKAISTTKDALKCLEEAGIIVCGDLNSDGNTAVRQFLVDGVVESSTRELLYPDIKLTSKRREQPYTFIDSAELAYGSNVCDGDYGEDYCKLFEGLCRPATYVVPNLASLLISPLNKDEGENNPNIIRTEFGHQIAKGLATTLSLQDFRDNEIQHAFDNVDLDNNGIIDEDEVQQLLGDVYVALYSQQIEKERRKFFDGFKENDDSSSNKKKVTLTKKEFSDKLLTIQGQLDGVADGLELTKGLLIDTLGMKSFCDNELDAAFQALDLDGNNLIEEKEIETLLQNVYKNTYGKRIERQKEKFFGNFYNDEIIISSGKSLTLEQFKERLLALQQELEGGNEGSELSEIKTDLDAQRMIDKFSPILRNALDQIFDDICSSNDGESLSEDDVAKFLIKVNGQLGRGGTWRHTNAMFEKKREDNDAEMKTNTTTSTKPVFLTRQDWYGVFARELAEGKWWQVVHDLEVCGIELRPKLHHATRHYQGWLDYIYFDSDKLSCDFVQESLTPTELCRIYKDGDALPTEWHPSDHLPVAAVISWR